MAHRRPTLETTSSLLQHPARRVLLRVTYLLVQSLLPCGHSTIGLFEITTLLATVYLRWPCHLPDRLTTGAGSHRPTSRVIYIQTEGGHCPEGFTRLNYSSRTPR